MLVIKQTKDAGFNIRCRCGCDVSVKVQKIRKSSVSIGVTAPRDVRILRWELTETERDERNVFDDQKSDCVSDLS